MTWQAIVLIRALIVIFATIIQKNVASLDSRIRNLSWMFFFCAVISIMLFVVLIFFKQANLLRWLPEMSKVALICMFTNTLGCYCAWRAIDISVSKTGLFSQGINYVAFALGYLLLGETKFLNLGVIIGIILCFSAGAIFAFYKKSIPKNRAIMLWTIGFSLSWGLDDFFTRYFALEVPTINFLSARYFGTYLGTLLLLFVANKLGNKAGFEEKDLIKSPLKGRLGQVFLLAIAGAWVAMVFEYWIRQRAPLIATEPINLILAIIVPVIVIFITVPALMKIKIIPQKYLEKVYEEYQEVKQISRPEMLAYLLGIAGGISVGLSM